MGVVDLIPSTRENFDRKCSKIFKMILVLFGKSFSVCIELEFRRDVGEEALDDLIPGISLYPLFHDSDHTHL